MHYAGRGDTYRSPLSLTVVYGFHPVLNAHPFRRAEVTSSLCADLHRVIPKPIILSQFEPIECQIRHRLLSCGHTCRYNVMHVLRRGSEINVNVDCESDCVAGQMLSKGQHVRFIC